MSPKQFNAALGRLKWTQRQAAEELGVEQSSIYRWAHGKRAIPGPVAAALKARIALAVCLEDQGNAVITSG